MFLPRDDPQVEITWKPPNIKKAWIYSDTSNEKYTENHEMERDTFRNRKQEKVKSAGFKKYCFPMKHIGLVESILYFERMN